MLNYYRSRFFLAKRPTQEKYRLVKWDIICQPKQQGGLGIQNLELQNKCLLSKWLFKVYNEHGIWQSLLRNKYVRNKTLGEVTKKAIGSHFWKDRINVKDQFLN